MRAACAGFLAMEVSMEKSVGWRKIVREDREARRPISERGRERRQKVVRAEGLGRKE